MRERGPVGLPPRPRARRPGLRPGEAGAAQRDPRPRRAAAPIVFGCQAPDSGNAEILAHYGTPEQKERYLEPLLRQRDRVVLLDDRAAGRRRPEGVHAPGPSSTATSGSSTARSGSRRTPASPSFLIVMAVTDPDDPPYQRMSMFVVPTDTPGRRDHPQRRRLGHEPSERGHARLHPLRRTCASRRDHLLGGRGEGFVVAQTRLGGGRIHHAMRTVGLVQAGVRHDVRAGAVAHDAGRDARPASSSCRR